MSEPKSTPTHTPCCSAHGVDMDCETYRRSHFVEVRPCCKQDAAGLRREKQREEQRELELWSVLDWSLWGNGLGDTLRESMADAMVGALTDEQREQAETCIKAWHERRGPSVAVGVGTQLEQERDEARAELDAARAALEALKSEVGELRMACAGLVKAAERLVARQVPDGD